MKNLKQGYFVEEIGGKFVIVDRQTWDNENPQAIRSMVHSARLAGEFSDRASAEAACERMNAEGAVDLAPLSDADLLKRWHAVEWPSGEGERMAAEIERRGLDL